MKKTVLYAAAAALFFLSSVSCDTVSGPSDPEPAITTYQGDWAGTTADGLAVSFTVVGNSITTFSVEIRNTYNAEIIPFTSAEATAISETDFNLNAKGPLAEENASSFYAPAINVSGTFSSLTAAQGLAGNQTSNFPVTSWTAAKK